MVNNIFDACGKAAVSCIGHPDILAAIHRQIDTPMQPMHIPFFTSETSEQLANNLTANTPSDLD